jgi:transposase, IS30 family
VFDKIHCSLRSIVLVHSFALSPYNPNFSRINQCPLWVVSSTGRRNTIKFTKVKGVLQMKQRRRIYYTETQKALMWDRWQKGESLHSIGRLFNKGHSSISPVFLETGGIRPPKRTRSRLALSQEEREEISREIATHSSMRTIAVLLDRSPSTISREIKRNGGYDHYRAVSAEQEAWKRAKRPKRCKLLSNKQLSQIVAKKLRRQWSPQQIAGWLKTAYPEDEGYQVSHETIYRTLFIQARGALKKELQQCLRSKRVMRRSKHASLKNKGLGKIVNAISISKRPASVEDRAIPGHWEGDLIQGTNNTFIATLVERHSRYVMLAKLENKNTATVIAALIKQSKKLPKELCNGLMIQDTELDIIIKTNEVNNEFKTDFYK